MLSKYWVFLPIFNRRNNEIATYTSVSLNFATTRVALSFVNILDELIISLNFYRYALFSIIKVVLMLKYNILYILHFWRKMYLVFDPIWVLKKDRKQFWHILIAKNSINMKKNYSHCWNQRKFVWIFMLWRYLFIFA